jgi:hypothetical protein
VGAEANERDSEEEMRNHGSEIDSLVGLDGGVQGVGGQHDETLFSG